MICFAHSFICLIAASFCLLLLIVFVFLDRFYLAKVDIISCLFSFLPYLDFSSPFVCFSVFYFTEDVSNELMNLECLILFAFMRWCDLLDDS